MILQLCQEEFWNLYEFIVEIKKIHKYPLTFMVYVEKFKIKMYEWEENCLPQTLKIDGKVFKKFVEYIQDNFISIFYLSEDT